MKTRIIIKILSSLVNLITGLVVAIIILYFQDWFGSGDIYSYIFWSIPLSIGIAVYGKSILNLFPIKNKILRLLMSLMFSVVISFGWVFINYLIFGPLLSAFSIPIFLLWIISVFFQLVFIDTLIKTQFTKTTAENYTQLILGFPIVLILSMILSIIGLNGISLIGSYISKPIPMTFLIPNNFRGGFKIIYGEKCGLMPPIENGRRTFRIPTNGILIVQPEFEIGSDYEYYFIDNIGKRTKIKNYENYSKGTKNIPGVRKMCTGSILGVMPNGGYSSESPLSIRYAHFNVYQDSIDRNDFKVNRKFDSLITVFVEECRNLNKE